MTPPRRAVRDARRGRGVALASVVLLLGATDVARAQTATSPPSGDIVLAPATIDFGDVARGVSRALDVEVTNNGRGPRGMDLHVTGIRRPDTEDCAAFELQTPDLPVTMRPGEDATWRVTVRSDIVGRHACTIDVLDDDGNSDVLSLSVTIVSPAMAVQPAMIAFGDVAVGGEAEQRISITNDGTAPLSITAIAAGGSTAFALSGLRAPDSIPARTTKALAVTYRPSAAGAHTGIVTISSDAPDRPSMTVTLRGNGVAVDGGGSRAALAVDPIDGNFGTVCAGQRAVRRFTLTSTGSAPLELARPRLVGGAAVFGLAMIAPASGAYPATLTRSQTATLEVTAAPASEGVASATLQIRSDAAGGGTHDVGLVVASITRGVGVSPSSLAFTQVPPGARSAPTSIAISNCSSTPLEIIDLDVTGPDAAAFDVGGTLPPPTIMLPAARTMQWMVAFAPQHPGEHTATLEIVHGDGTVSIPLVGSAQAGDDAGAPVPDSYYGCSLPAHRGAGTAATVAIGVALVVRRRRTVVSSRR